MTTRATASMRTGPAVSSTRRSVLGCLSLASAGARLDASTSSARPSRRNRFLLAMARSPVAARTRGRLRQKVGLHGGEDREQMVAVRLGHAFQSFATGGGAYRKNFAQQRMGLRGEMQQPNATVLGMGAPLDELRLLQPVEDAGQCDRLDFEDLGQSALLDALVAPPMRQHRALRARELQPARIRLEALAHQARHVMQEKAKIAFGKFHWILLLSEPNISLLMTLTRAVLFRHNYL